MHTKIEAVCVDQALQITSLPPLASGGEGEVTLHVSFDDTWTSAGKLAVFYRDEKEVYQVVMTEDTCAVPRAVYVEPGTVYIGVVGIDGAVVRTTEVVPVKWAEGAASSVTGHEPLPDIYKQVLTAYGSVNASVNAERAERKREVAVERARIDQLTKLEDGSTTGDAELQDIRVDAGGTTHDSAGAAVREQVVDLRRHHVKPNLIDLNKLSAGYLTDADNVTATAMAEDCYYSDYIAVDSTLPYYLSVNNHLSYTSQWLAVNTYDSDKTFIKRQSWYVGEKQLNFDEAVAYVRVSFRGLYLHDVKLEQSSYPTAVEHTTSPNLHDVYPLTLPGYVDSPGSIHVPTQEGYMAEGVIANERYSRYIPVSAGDVYVIYNGVEEYPWCGVGFYGADGAFLERQVVKTDEHDCAEIVVPAGAVAMRYSARTYTQHDFVVYRKTGLNDYMAEYVKALIAKYTTPIPVWHPVKAIAHRGYSSDAPENTIPAYKLAKRKGYDYVECDVAFTADGTAVLLHDSTIDRTSSGTGSISDLTFTDVRSLDFGAWFGEAYAGTVIPTFEEFIAFCRNVGLRPYVELKAGTEAQVKSLVDVVARHGMLKETTWISFSADYLAYIREMDNTARLGLTVETVTTDIIAACLSLRNGENEVFIDSHSYTGAEVELCVSMGIPLEVWTVNSATTIRSMPGYVTGVTSDSQHAGRVLHDYSMEV